MGTGGKIAIGCGIALLIGVLVVVVTVGAGIFWAKGKVEQVAAEQKEIQDFQAKANENAFSEPSDGVITEPQLLKFIEVRKRVYAVYEKNEATIRAFKDKNEGDIGDVRKGFALMNEIRLAQAKAQAEQAMSDAEYAFLVQQVYKSSWAAQAADSSGGKSVSEAAGEANDQAEEAREAAQSLDVPPANVALFRKYEADLKKYAMSGLEWIGL